MNDSIGRLGNKLGAYVEEMVKPAMVLPDDVARYAYRCGLFVLVQSGEHIMIRNDAKFQPQDW
jgi:hypothetical protein